MTVLLDASAVLAWAFDEPAADRVEAELSEALVATPNWAEVLQKIVDRDRDATVVGGAMLGFGLTVASVDRVDAEGATSLWSRTQPLSLADRFCIAVGRRLDLPVWTCDRAWADVDPRVVVLR